jgi:hypothetical protein
MAGVGQSLCSGLHLRMHVHDGQLFGLHGLDETGRCVDQALTCELDAHRPIRFGAPTAKTTQARGCGQWTVRALARAGPLAVDNASRCPPRAPLPTCPQPPTTTIK